MRVPRVLSEAAETHRAVALVRVRVLHRDMVLCVSQATLRVSELFCGWGAAEVTRGRSAASQP